MTEENDMTPEETPLPEEEPEEENTPPTDDDHTGTELFPVDDGSPLRDIVDDMQESYITYAMSVIVSRALPDVRDGLKPVHRRVLYAMHEGGMTSSAKYRKSANVVGGVMAKYHPHGDTALYQSLVRMAQDFSLRYPLVDGQGNFGSIDGDNAAAMRYTECKMTKMAELMLRDIEKDTVDMRPNYDASEMEPAVLPSAVPQLLLNGTMGIAVGMATNIPPHNLRELIDASVMMLDNPETTLDELMTVVKGPDFPTAAQIYDGGAIREMYRTGRGGVIMRAKAEIEELKGGKPAIIFTEIPYAVNKAELIVKIADLVRDKKITGISDLRDESNREGIRIVVELKKDAFPNKVLNQLYRDTFLQKTFSMNMIALVDGIHPRLLSLKEVLQCFLDHRFEVVRRRTEYELAVAQRRAHILEGLKIALDHIDEVIAIIRKSPTKEEAGSALMKKFELSDAQVKAILEMRLQTLAGLERQKVEDELAEKLALIEELLSILNDRTKMSGVIRQEMLDVREKYGDERRTVVHPQGLGKFSAIDTIPNEEMLVVLTHNNYVKRMSPSQFRAQRRGGVGIRGSATKEEDYIVRTVYGKNHDQLLYFTTFGRVFSLPVYEVPECSRQAKGTPIVNLLQLQEGERITEVLNLGRTEGKYIFFCTTGGTVKRVEISQFANIRRSGLIACTLREGEYLYWAKVTGGEDKVFIVTHHGQSICFPETDARAMGRTAAGVRGIRLKTADKVIEMDILRDPGARLLVVTEKGLGKSSRVDGYREQSRGGSGIKVANVTAKTGSIAGARVLQHGITGDLLLVSKNGQAVRMALSEIPTTGRTTQGVILMRLGDSKDIVASLSILEEESEPQESAETKDVSAQPTLLAEDAEA